MGKGHCAENENRRSRQDDLLLIRAGLGVLCHAQAGEIEGAKTSFGWLEKGQIEAETHADYPPVKIHQVIAGIPKAISTIHR